MRFIKGDEKAVARRTNNSVALFNGTSTTVSSLLYVTRLGCYFRCSTFNEIKQLRRESVATHKIQSDWRADALFTSAKQNPEVDTEEGGGSEKKERDVRKRKARLGRWSPQSVLRIVSFHAVVCHSEN